MPVPAFLAPAAVGGFIKRAWPFLLAAAVGLVLLLTYCEGKRSGRARADLARERGNVEALEDKGKADANASAARTDSAVRAQAERRELEETIDEARSQGRDPRAAYYECVRLQQQARAAGRPAPAC